MDTKSLALIRKYNVPAPRYTSYPTVPYWEDEKFDVSKWREALDRCFREQAPDRGISLYIHLPFCESLCTYCGCNKRITKNHRMERPYIEAVLKEWELWRAILPETPLLREVHLGGGTPTFFSPDNLRSLLERLFGKARVHENASMSFEAHPSSTTKAHLETLYDLGFRRLSLGIQDFDPDVQQIINRIQPYEQVAEVTEQARLTGYTSLNYDLIYGLPRQQPTGLKATLDKVATLSPDRIAFYSYAHVPWNAPGQRRYTIADLPSPEDKQKLHQMGCNSFLASGYREIGMDHFARPHDGLFHAMAKGQLHRNFMGYTDQRTPLLMGLGVSSISDAWYAFAQNEKQLESYYARLNAAELPLLKGHILTGEDLTIRQHILELMCNGTTTFDDFSLNYQAIAEGLHRLRPFADDGLVRLTGQRVEIIPEGKRFLRNICMAFDARLWKNLPQSQLFSMAV